MTASPSPSPTIGATLDEVCRETESPVALETGPAELQSTRIVINTYGTASVVGVLHSDPGLTDVVWDRLLEEAAELWVDLQLAEIPEQQPATRANRENVFAARDYPAEIRAQVEAAWEGDDLLAIVEVVGKHRQLDVATLGWSTWGVSTVYF